MFLISPNYRKPLDFTEEALKAASKGWQRLNNCLSFGYIYKIKDQAKNEIILDKPIKKSANTKLDKDSFKLLSDFENYMDDDLNTSGALSILFELSQPIRKISGGPYAKSGSPKLINEKGVREKLGVNPNKVIDLKALTGDSSDNIPGVKGVGPKTAINLLNENNDLDGVYKSLKDISKIWHLDKKFSPKMKNPLRNKLLKGWAAAIKKTLSN